MDDKLNFKRKRVNWTVVLDLYCSDSVKSQYRIYYRKHCKKIRSNDRIAYNFLLHTFGRKYIASIRSGKFITTREELVKVIKTPWINVPDED